MDSGDCTGAFGGIATLPISRSSGCSSSRHGRMSGGVEIGEFEVGPVVQALIALSLIWPASAGFVAKAVPAGTWLPAMPAGSPHQPPGRYKPRSRQACHTRVT